MHEVRMLLQQYENNTISYLRYPKHRISYDEDENTVVIRLPSMLSLELFRTGILTTDKNDQIKLGISGKSIGKYILDDLRYPNDHSDIIILKFKRIKILSSRQTARAGRVLTIASSRQLVKNLTVQWKP